MRRWRQFSAFCSFFAVLANGCSNEANESSREPTGQLELAMEAGSSQHDVEAVQFRVVGVDETCNATAIAQRTVPLRNGELTDDAVGDGGGGAHSFAQSFFALRPAHYKVCMIPLADGGTPSQACATAQGFTHVIAGATAKLVLHSQCSNTNGGLSVVGMLNNPPEIENVHIDMRTASPCEQALMGVAVSDPDQDEIAFIGWSAEGPGDAVISGANPARLSVNAPGEYEVGVVVRDRHSAEVALRFPVYVTEEDLAGDICMVSSAADAYVRTDLDVRRNDNYGCESHVEVGTSRGGGGSSYGGPDAMRALIGFPITALPSGASIARATVEMTVQGFDEGQAGATYQVDLHRVLEAGLDAPHWQEGNGTEDEKMLAQCKNPDEASGVAWVGAGDGGDANNRTQPRFDPSVVATAKIIQSEGAVGEVVSWDITDLARAWYEGTMPNHGIMLRDVTTDGTFRGVRFGARDGARNLASEQVAAPRLVLELAMP